MNHCEENLGKDESSRATGQGARKGKRMGEHDGRRPGRPLPDSAATVTVSGTLVHSSSHTTIPTAKISEEGEAFLSYRPTIRRGGSTLGIP